MKYARFPRCLQVLCCLLTLLHGPLLRGQDPGAKGSSEYFSVNREGRLLIDVQVWGDVALPGIHHVPDNTSIVELLGFVGGAKGDLEDAKFRIRQKLADGQGFRTVELRGEELLDSQKAAQTILKSGDIVYIEAKSDSDKFMSRMNVITAVASLITSVIVTLFLVREKG